MSFTGNPNRSNVRRRPTKVEIQPPAIDPTVAPRRNKVAAKKLCLLNENCSILQFHSRIQEASSNVIFSPSSPSSRSPEVRADDMATQVPSDTPVGEQKFPFCDFKSYRSYITFLFKGISTRSELIFVLLLSK